MESGLEVRIAVATPTGCVWVPGHIDKIRVGDDGRGRVDFVAWDGRVFPNCDLNSLVEVSER